MTELSFADFTDEVERALEQILPDRDTKILSYEMDTDYEVMAWCEGDCSSAVETARYFIEINPQIEAVASELLYNYMLEISDTTLTTAQIVENTAEGMDAKSIAKAYGDAEGLTSINREAGAVGMLESLLESNEMGICSNAGAVIEDVITLVEEKDKALDEIVVWLELYINDYQLSEDDNIVQMYERTRKARRKYEVVENAEKSAVSVVETFAILAEPADEIGQQEAKKQNTFQPGQK